VANDGYYTWTAETGMGFVPQEYGVLIEAGYPVSALAETGIFQQAALPGFVEGQGPGGTALLPGQTVPELAVAGANPLAAILPLLGTAAGKYLLPLLSKYWPQIAGVAGSLGIGALIGGLGGNGGGVSVIPGTDIALGGPFAPEPAAGMIAKEWGGIGGSRFYLLINGRVVVRKSNGTWRLIKRPKMLHMKISNPRMGDVVKADRIVARTAKILRRRLK